MFLERVNSPEELKKLSIGELKLYAEEVREFLVNAVSVSGGHLASNLGVVELTIALHYVFDCYKDRFLFDVGHQSYVHKIITGRRDGFSLLRQDGGISGFPSPEESSADSFVTGHSSTSLSLGLGLARARDLDGESFNVLPVIGDGSFSGGMVYEALSDIGESKTKLTIILNDNRMSISRNIGAVSRYLTKLRLSRRYNKFRANLKKSLSALPFTTQNNTLNQAKVRIKEFFLHSRLFENFGISYYGPIDGHDLAGLVGTFRKVALKNRPSIVHLVTKKGKGYPQAEDNPEYFHGISAAKSPIGNDVKATTDVVSKGLDDSKTVDFSANKETYAESIPTYARHNMRICGNSGIIEGATNGVSGQIDDGKISGLPSISSANSNGADEREQSFSSVVGRTLCELAFDDEKIVAITAAMGIGTGLESFERQFPKRYFDVAIAEQHAVSLAAGLAAGGFKPFFAVYSTFLQRGFDQILHEVSINKLPVRFLIDRAGAVGSDGVTHQGIFDLSYLSLIPNMAILAPKDGDELAAMIKWASKFDGPLAIRYPKSFFTETTDILRAEKCKAIGGNAQNSTGVIQFGDDAFSFSSRLKAQSSTEIFDALERTGTELRLGEWEILRRGDCEVYILACGDRMVRLANKIQGATIINARFVKPLDAALLDSINKKGNLIITLEDNVLSGGFGSSVLSFMNTTNIYAKLVCVAHLDSHLFSRDIGGALVSSGLTVDNILDVIKSFREYQKLI